MLKILLPKHAYIMRISAFVFLTMLFVCGELSGQSFRRGYDRKEISGSERRKMDDSELSQLQKRLNTDEAWISLKREAEKRGYQGFGEIYAERVVVKFTNGSSLSFTHAVFDLKSKKKESAAMILLADEGSAYRALVIGDYDQAKEYFISQNKDKRWILEKGNSWKSCVKNAIKLGNCGLSCAADLARCTTLSLLAGQFSWAVFTGCMAESCGGCLAQEIAWCKIQEWLPEISDAKDWVYRKARQLWPF